MSADEHSLIGHPGLVSRRRISPEEAKPTKEPQIPYNERTNTKSSEANGLCGSAGASANRDGGGAETRSTTVYHSLILTAF